MREPTNTWNKLKSRFCSPTTKAVKFKGRGQRDTPVINGPGIVRLLFLLPGPRARLFASESAETLIRYIGGDETLIAEIYKNKEIAQRHPKRTLPHFLSRQNAHLHRGS